VSKQNNEMHSTSGFKNAIYIHISNEICTNNYHFASTTCPIVEFHDSNSISNKIKNNNQST
jgi:hypothetical protein